MGTSGLEPPTSRLSGVRSNHLSYAPKLLLIQLGKTIKRVTRIELATTAWKAVVLPLNYTRNMITWRETESNRRHMELQSIALPTELPSQQLHTYVLREQDLNLRPSGYEPDELPNCSIPRQLKGGCGIRTHARFYTPDGFQDRSLQPDLGNPPK